MGRRFPSTANWGSKRSATSFATYGREEMRPRRREGSEGFAKKDFLSNEFLRGCLRHLGVFAVAFQSSSSPAPVKPKSRPRPVLRHLDLFSRGRLTIHRAELVHETRERKIFVRLRPRHVRQRPLKRRIFDQIER